MNEDSGIRYVKLKSWSQFCASFSDELWFNDNFHPERFLFRGQGSSDYKLISSFDRRFQNLPITERVRKYKRVINYFFELYRTRVQSDAGEQEMLSAAQHYGLPTRLLDWSSNPMVAGYFAFSGAITSQNSKGDVAIWALDRESPLIHHELGLNVFTAHKNKRADVQSGYFSNLTGVFDSLEEYVESSGTQGAATLTCFTIPISDARNAFSYLSSCGFTSFSMFPDNVGLANGALEMEWLADVNSMK